MFENHVVQECLQKSGWYPNRIVDISHYVNTLSKKGFQIFPIAQQFLEEFGGLRVEHPSFRFLKSLDSELKQRMIEEGYGTVRI